MAFAQGGYAATSVEDIAAASGITKPIFYRHFDSKQEVYQAVLQRVSERLAEEFKSGMERGYREGLLVRSQLIVARENPDGYSLLWRHAAREPEFASYAIEFREGAVRSAETRLETVRPSILRRWAAQTIVSFLVESVLNWIEMGADELDDAFVDMATRSLREIVRAWSPAA